MKGAEDGSVMRPLRTEGYISIMILICEPDRRGLGRQRAGEGENAAGVCHWTRGVEIIGWTPPALNSKIPDGQQSESIFANESRLLGREDSGNAGGETKRPNQADRVFRGWDRKPWERKRISGL